MTFSHKGKDECLYFYEIYLKDATEVSAIANVQGQTSSYGYC
jgi:hypothetical protein